MLNLMGVKHVTTRTFGSQGNRMVKGGKTSELCSIIWSKGEKEYGIICRPHRSILGVNVTF